MSLIFNILKFIKMKKNLYASFFLLILVAICTSCTKQDEAISDPPGTITISINYTSNAAPITLFSGLAADGPYVYNTYTYPYLNLFAGMDVSLNFVYYASVVQNNSGSLTNPIWYGLGMGSYGCEVANVGKVSGLGSITSKPSSGWASTGAVQIGYGYVIRYRNSKNSGPSTLPYSYARLYVVDWLKSVSGAVIGATMKYEPSF